MKRMWTIAIIGLTLLAVNPDAARAGKKSPVAATLMSAVLPGAGQFYNGQSGKGWLMAGTYLSTMSLVIAYGPSTWEEKKSSDDPFADLAPGTSGTTKAIWYGSVGVAGLVWIWSVIDAPKAAKKINKENYSLLPYFKGDMAGIQLSINTGF